MPDSPASPHEASTTGHEDVAMLDAVIVGAGFGGMHMLHRLREIGFTAIVLEAGSDVGGAWYWNRYPGARCDVESLAYCYSFSPIIDAEWRWSELYAAQPEIMRYMRFVSERLDLRRDIRFDARVAAAHFDAGSDCWDIRTTAGESYRARHFISAAGPISAPIWPDIPDRERFRGELYHTALWPQDAEPDFAGKRVGVIGNGSSGTQLVSAIADSVGHLTLFIRTSNYYTEARNRKLTEADYHKWEQVRDDYRRKFRTFEIIGNGDIFMAPELQQSRFRKAAEFSREERLAIMEGRWNNGGAAAARPFADTITDDAVNEEVSEFWRQKIRGIVKDPAVADILTPDFPLATKRGCVGNGYLDIVNRDNVDVIAARATPIERFVENGVIVDGKVIELDVVICASGFDALTGALTAIDIRGDRGQSLKEEWAEGVETFLGIGLAGFPNMHMIGGPKSLSVLVNVVVANEYQVGWIADLLDHMRRFSLTRADVRKTAQMRWTRHVDDVIRGTVFERADSWYVGTNVPGKKKEILAYAGGIVKYIAACDRVRSSNWKDYVFSSAAS